MTASGTDLPADLIGLLAGEQLEDGVGLVIQVLTADDDGWPRSCLLSAGEVLATGPQRLRLALWTGTHSTANLTRSGRATLVFVWDGAAFAVRVSTDRASDVRVGDHAVAVFDARVLEVRRDEVSYARLTSGMTFDLPDEERVLARWREQRAALRASARQ